ncbi:hypothetical protein vseg_016512 [Gypsophila vaccaria]
MECYRKNDLTILYIFVLFIIITTLVPLNSALKVGFYSKSCPNAETIVQQTVMQRFSKDKSVTAALLRLHFHDCFVRGCDASILINSTANNQAEKDAGANASVREYALIDEIKSKLESNCTRTVSCSDIIALATRDAIALARGPKYQVPTGRRDGLKSRSVDVDLPSPDFTVAQAQKAFAKRGLNVNDMVALLGGHTVGVAHCNFFEDRVTDFQGTGAPDGTMDKGLLQKLQGLCGKQDTNPSTFLDQNTSFTVDNEYYKQIMMRKGVLQIDQEIALDSKTSKIVSDLGRDNKVFRKRFANAMIKMGMIRVLQGNAGEIRRKCSVFNKNANANY